MALKLTKPAPEWSGTAVVNGEFKDISLADYRGKYVVLLFYPADLWVANASLSMMILNMFIKVFRHSRTVGYVINSSLGFSKIFLKLI